MRLGRIRSDCVVSGAQQLSVRHPELAPPPDDSGVVGGGSVLRGRKESEAELTTIDAEAGPVLQRYVHNVR